MATFQSRVEVKQACQKLFELEQKIKELLQSSEELPLDQIEEILAKQSRLIGEIDFTPPGEELPDDIAGVVKKFNELREKNRAAIQKSMDNISRQLDSLDQSNELMRHYMQGGMRDEESSSARIDHNA